jgi:hypothetical protein
MKNNLLYLLLFIVAALICLVFLVGNNKSSFSKKDTIYALKKEASFDKISIESGTNKFFIEKVDGKWLIDGKDDANASKIANMINALENVQMQFPVPAEAAGRIHDSILKNGTTISLYKKNKVGYQLRFFDFNYRTAALTPKGEPVLIQIRTYTNLPLGVIISNNRTAWRKNLLFNFNKNNINHVKLYYTAKPDDGFLLQNIDSTIRVFSVDGKEDKNIDVQNANDYLNFFKEVCYETRDKNKYTEDFSTVAFSMEIENKIGDKTWVQGYNLYQPNTTIKDINTFAAIVNNRDTIHLNYSILDPILVAHSYFLKK